MLLRRLARAEVLRSSGFVCQRCARTTPASIQQTRSFTATSSRLDDRPTFGSFKPTELGSPEQHAELEQNGIPDLYSADAFKTAFTDYQKLLLSKIDAIATGTALGESKIIDIILFTAREPDYASLFNSASMLWNNDFYFKGIANPPVPMTPNVETAIKESFGSVSAFEQTMLSTANAMFGPGFVWLVQEKENARSLKIVATYLAGSPHPGAHFRRQGLDMNTQPPENHTAGSFGDRSANNGLGKRIPYTGQADMTPLLCVNTWEHAWLPQFGIAGKNDFLNAWYRRINWQEVDSHLTPMNLDNNFWKNARGARPK